MDRWITLTEQERIKGRICDLCLIGPSLLFESRPNSELFENYTLLDANDACDRKTANTTISSTGICGKGLPHLKTSASASAAGDCSSPLFSSRISPERPNGENELLRRESPAEKSTEDEEGDIDESELAEIEEAFFKMLDEIPAEARAGEDDSKDKEEPSKG